MPEPESSLNGAAFKACVEQVPAPCLLPDGIVVMDNLRSHKVAGVRQAIKARHAYPAAGISPFIAVSQSEPSFAVWPGMDRFAESAILFIISF